MKHIIEGANAEHGDSGLALNDRVRLWLQERTGRTGSLQQLMNVYAAQRGAPRVNELAHVKAPDLCAIRWRNEQVFHAGPGRPHLHRRPRTKP